MSVQDEFAGETRDLSDMRRRLKAIFIGSIGNLVEWFDFYAYAAFALYFASSFFPKDNEIVQQLNATLIFALGFLIRPVGGWLFGAIADNFSRRASLVLSVTLMCLGSFMIALAPTYASVGILSPIILAVARLIQGLSLGGEYGSSATYLSEIADKKHRGFYTSFQYVTLIGGQLCALLVLILLQNVFLTNDEIREWGWRIPFAVGGFLAIGAALLRRTLHEPAGFENAKKKNAGKSTLRTLFQYPKEVFLVVGLTMGGTLAFYTFTTYMQKFLKLTVHLDDNQTTLVTAGSLFFAMCLQPIYGIISDYVGRKWLLILFGVGGTLFTLPILTNLQVASGPMAAFLLICSAWLFIAGYTSINAVVKAELFPMNIRATGVGLPYALTVSIFGGTAESIALWTKDQAQNNMVMNIFGTDYAVHESWFFYYVTGIIALSLLVYITMRDTKHRSAMDS